MITNILRVLLTRSFKPLAFTNIIQEKLDLKGEKFGIYVHIPFCKTLCSFCPYNKVEYNKDLVERYKKALIGEINSYGGLYTKKNITSVYFGGGTPALMLDDLEDIIQCLRKNFTISCNIGIELHPRDINESCLKKLKNIGFNMISIGIQSFQKSYLHSLGREYIDGKSKVEMVNRAGFKVIDVDLIFGIVKQSKEDLKKDLITAFNSGATQVSTYPFIDFSYAQNKNKPLGRKEKKELLKCIEETISKINCERTSVWTFGRRNSEKYSSITRDAYIGFGPSAASLTKKVFQVNTFSVEEYISSINNKRNPAALSLKFTERTRALYWLFWNAYTLKLDNKAFFNLFHKNLEQVFGIELKLAEITGLINKVSNVYELTKKGAYLYHIIEQNYTHQYIDKTWKKAREEAWPKYINLY
jgi:oxygen-independent coproporphyrinogen-3 oxidase